MRTGDLGSRAPVLNILDAPGGVSECALSRANTSRGMRNAPHGQVVVVRAGRVILPVRLGQIMHLRPPE